MENESDRQSKSNAPEASGTNFLQRIGGHVQGKALGGFMELVPLLVSAIVIWFVVGWADQFVRPMAFVAGKPWDLPGIGIVAAVIIFYLVGVVVSTRIGKIIMDRKHDILHRVPIVKTIYGVTYQATTSISGQFRFTRVVFIEWPREGMVALGFVTGRAHRERKDTMDENEPQSMAVVYIPTVPNPTSGNLAFVMEDDLMETDLTVEDAMKVVFSGGIVLPESVSMARFARVRGDGEFIDRFTIDPKQSRRFYRFEGFCSEESVRRNPFGGIRSNCSVLELGLRGVCRLSLLLDIHLVRIAV